MIPLQRSDRPDNRLRLESTGRVQYPDRTLRARKHSSATSDWNLGYILPAEEAKEIVRLAIKHRWDLRALVRAAGISTCANGNQGVELTRNHASLGMQHLWRVTDDDLMGLARIGVPRGALRLLTFVVCSAPNLATALRRYQEFRAAFPGLPAVAIEESGDYAALSIDHAAFDPSSVSTVSVALLVVAHRIIKWATRRPFALHRVELPHARPSRHAGYQIVFGAPPLFDRPRVALVFEANVLTQSFVRSHDDIESFLDDPPASLLADCNFYPPLSAQVRFIIEDSLGNSCCTSEIAAGVGMSRPTLWRRLREENTSISEIRDQVLRDVALASLARGDETIAQLSQRLGFSEPSAFSRAFRRWTGCSPRSYRSTPAVHASAALQWSAAPSRSSRIPCAVAALTGP